MILVETVDPNDSTAVNIARLLLSLDSDPSDDRVTLSAESYVNALGLSVGFSNTEAFEAVAADLVARTVEGGILVSDQDAIAHMAIQSRTAHLALETPEGIEYDYGIQSFALGAPFTTTDLNSSTYTLAMADVGTQTLQFGEGGTGSIAFSSNDTNQITWSIDATGRILFTEQEQSGTDSWSRIITRIKPTSSGADVLVEINTPAGQEDFAHGAALGTLTSNDTTISLAGVWDKTESYDVCPGLTIDRSTDTFSYNSVTGFYTSNEDWHNDIKMGDPCWFEADLGDNEIEEYPGTSEMNAAELRTSLEYNSSEIQGVVINSTNQFTVTLMFSSGGSDVTVTQIWTRRP